MYKVILSKQAMKDYEKLKAAGMLLKAKKLLDIVKVDPFQNPPPYEKPIGNLSGFYSRRINIQHRLVYAIREEEQVVHVLRMLTYYE
ncbi:Plasmid encoded toxin Txe [Eubacteriaceae bacterium CHKCI005]|nr:Plasmid encoded toxin Txe [Eubacteriaceae bacterium CHKCI005]